LLILKGEQPPFGDVDDRIRAIATGLGLRTIMWKYDSNDWQEGLNGVTSLKVDADYKAFLDASTGGSFNAVSHSIGWKIQLTRPQRGGVILAHELNNFTMEEAMKFYPQMKANFKVRWYSNALPFGDASLHRTSSQWLLPTTSPIHTSNRTTRSQPLSNVGDSLVLV